MSPAHLAYRYAARDARRAATAAAHVALANLLTAPPARRYRHAAHVARKVYRAALANSLAGAGVPRGWRYV